MNILENLWHSAIVSSRTIGLVGVCIGLLATISIFCRYFSIQIRFAKNLRRKIYFLKTSDKKSLQTQKGKIKNLKLFDVKEEIKDISNSLDVLQTLKDNAVYIVGYDKNYQNYEKLFERARSKNIPIILFAKHGEIQKESWDLINEYIYCDVANTTNRLAIILLNILKIT